MLAVGRPQVRALRGARVPTSGRTATDTCPHFGEKVAASLDGLSQGRGNPREED